MLGPADEAFAHEVLEGDADGTRESLAKMHVHETVADELAGCRSRRVRSASPAESVGARDTTQYWLTKAGCSRRPMSTVEKLSSVFRKKFPSRYEMSGAETRDKSSGGAGGLTVMVVSTGMVLPLAER